MSARACSLRVAVVALLAGCSLSAAEIVQFRSGQSGGLPGTPGSFDDSIRINPWGNPGGAPVLNTAFTLGDFVATDGGPAAVVVAPIAQWMGGQTAPLSDPDARWINWTADPFGQGTAGSVLYSVPFWVNTSTITNAVLTFEGGADDVLGDWLFGGPNADGLYINGTPAGYQYVGFNYANPTTHVQNITGMISPGQNYLYFYQRDAGFGVSGIIFSGTIDIVPAPGAAVLLGLAPLALGRRVRKA
jgi:hypothetical protein